MKQHISIEQLVEIGTEKVLTLANHSLIETIWEDFDTVKKVDRAISTFNEKGWKHSTLLNTAKKCTVANLLAMLNDYGKVVIENMHDDYGTKWYVYINHHPETNRFEFEAEELCDALWDAVKQETIL